MHWVAVAMLLALSACTWDEFDRVGRQLGEASVEQQRTQALTRPRTCYPTGYTLTCY